jgi:hypothetical protein
MEEVVDLINLNNPESVDERKTCSRFRASRQG